MKWWIQYSKQAMWVARSQNCEPNQSYFDTLIWILKTIANFLLNLNPLNHRVFSIFIFLEIWDSPNLLISELSYTFIDQLDNNIFILFYTLIGVGTSDCVTYFRFNVHSSPLYMSARLQNYGLGESFNAFNRSNDSDENNKNIENIHISLLLFTNTFHHLSSLINSRIERVAKINYSLLMKSKYLSEDRRQASPGGSSIFPGLFIFVSLQIRVKKSMRNLVKLEKCRPKSYSFSLKAPLSWFMFTYSRLLCFSIHTHDGAERALPLMNGAELPLQRWERKQACCAVRFVRRLDAESFQRWKIILLLYEPWRF